MNVIKRNGEIVPFDGERIVRAINKAFLEVDGQIYETDTASDIALEIGQKADKLNRPYSVEEIQDMVEDYLMRSERKDVARAYIRYRYKKEVARNIKSDFFDAVGEKLEARNVQRQNANVDEYSFGGRVGEASGVMTKQYALDNLISPMAKKHHLNNEIYIHDLDAYAVGMHNCLSIPFDKLLANGFNTRQMDVRPANSINSAMQLVAVIFQLQSLQQFGGVSATHLDWTMVPYVRKSFFKHWKDGRKYLLHDNKNYAFVDEPIDSISYKENDEVYTYAMDMLEREVHQAVEGLYHNLNTLQSRSGNQLKCVAG